MLRVGGNHHQLAAGTGGEGAVLGEEGGDGHELRLRCGGKGPHDGDERGSRAAAHEQILGPDTGVVALVQVPGDGVPGGEVADGGGVAVDLHAVGIGQDGPDGVVHLLGSGDGGIAQTVVKYILRADDFGLLQAILKQIADNGTVGPQGPHFFGNHSCLLSKLFPFHYNRLFRKDKNVWTFSTFYGTIAIYQKLVCRFSFPRADSPGLIRPPIQYEMEERKNAEL